MPAFPTNEMLNFCKNKNIFTQNMLGKQTKLFKKHVFYCCFDGFWVSLAQCFSTIRVFFKHFVENTELPLACHRETFDTNTR